MKVAVVPIGNSKGIRIPKPILQECHIGKALDLSVVLGRIVLKPLPASKSPPRALWAGAFQKMRAMAEDRLLLPEAFDADLVDWVW